MLGDAQRFFKLFIRAAQPAVRLVDESQRRQAAGEDTIVADLPGDGERFLGIAFDEPYVRVGEAEPMGLGQVAEGFALSPPITEAAGRLQHGREVGRCGVVVGR